MLVVLCVSLLVVSLDNTILNVALPDIVRSLHATSSELQWIVDAYSVVFAGLLLVAGSLGDRLGRKWVFLAGLVLFAAGSSASSFSGSPDRLIAARAFMGVGAAAIMPSTLSILTNLFPDPGDRARAIGIWSGTTGLGLAVGPVAGGWLLAHYWWGSVFLVNVPIALIGLAVAAFLVPNSRSLAPRRADPLGAAVSIVGVGLGLWGIIEAPTRSWTSPAVLAALGASALVVTAFVAWERRSSHPMLHVGFFRMKRFSVAIAAMGLVVFALMGGLFLLTQYLQFSLGFSALQAGLRVAPIAALLLVVAPLSSFAVRALGTKPVVFAGMALITVGLLLLSRVTVRGTYADALPALLLIGGGAGLAFAPCTDSVMGSLPLEEAGVGAATNSAALEIGGALGVAVVGSVLSTRYQDHLLPLLAPRHVPAPVATTILGSLGGALAVAQQAGGQLGRSLAAAAREAFVGGMDLAVVVAAAAVGAAAIVVLALLPNRPPDPATNAAGPSGSPPATESSADAHGREDGSAPRAR